MIVSIDDDGPGIPNAGLDGAFDSFYPLSPAEAAGPAETGLGLTVARSTSRAHDGDIRLANREGDGLSVTETVPPGGSP